MHHSRLGLTVTPRQEEWHEAETRLGCSLLDFNSASGERDMSDHEVFAREITYPKCIKEREFVDWVIESERQKQARTGAARFHPTYASWVNTLPDSCFEKDDGYDIRRAFYFLLFHWRDHENANARADKRESEIRAGVDAMIKMAFELRDGHTHRTETDLILPGSPWVAKADNICTIDLPSEWLLFLAKLPNKQVFSSDEKSFAVITFVCEDKVTERKHAARQLTLDLCSAQRQRRALGFKKSKAFGATLVDTELHFFVSEWDGDVVPTNKRFDLRSFDEFLSCYIFLCRLAEFEASNIRSVFDRWNSEEDKQDIKKRNIAESRKEPWRPLAPPSSPGSHKRKKGGGGEDEDEEDDDDTESVHTNEAGQRENDAGAKIAEVRAENEEQVPPGGLRLSAQNLRALDYLSRVERIPGQPSVDEWARYSAAGCDGVTYTEPRTIIFA